MMATRRLKQQVNIKPVFLGRSHHLPPIHSSVMLPRRFESTQATASARRAVGAAASRELSRRDSDLLHLAAPINDVSVQKEYLIDSLKSRSTAVATDLVPWFLDNMPESYFQQVPAALREQHLRALAGLREGGALPNATLTSADGSTVTMIKPTNEPGQLLTMLEDLTRLRAKQAGGDRLVSVQSYLAKDASVSLNVFTMAPSKTQGLDKIPADLSAYLKELQAGKFKNDALHAPASPIFDEANVLAFVQRCRPEYVQSTSPRRLCLHMQMYAEVAQKPGKPVTERSSIHVERSASKPEDTMIALALTNVDAMAAVSRVCRFLASKSVDVSRVSMDVVDDGAQPVTLLRVLTTRYTDPKTKVSTSWSDLPAGSELDLLRASKWLDDRVLDLVQQDPAHLFGKSALAAETVVALADLVHGTLASVDPYQYARARVLWAMTSAGPSRDCAEQIVRAFCSKHSPRFAREHPSNAPYDSEEMKRVINATVEQPMKRAILEKLVECAEGVMRTNLGNDARFALSMRVDPKICMPPTSAFGVKDNERKDLPYGVFFVSGRRFTSFHVRFRDIARGGLRVVTPANAELLTAETARHFNECYDLSFAQQLKNKDIAEGGAKAVMIVDTVGLPAAPRLQVMRQSVRAFTDSVLDLLAPNPPNEILYFGPDEQIIPDDIEYIAERSVERGYPLGPVFISSKRDAGINHKQYGVTSEGVNVFLAHALREAGIEPTKERFTIKITGGPDGDVAGNMLRLLYRDYGENARVVGLSDATGVVEDPQGLEWKELMRLFKEGLPLSSFNSAVGFTSQAGYFGLASDQTGLLKRNTMHMRVQSDAFVPAGGRPATINASNYKGFFIPGTNQPSSRIIVEGANLFITAEARKLLSQEGNCMIVKDSSANKAGVICSSYEVLAGMLVPEKESFMAIKEPYVEQVLERLKYLAHIEAAFLMREWRTAPAKGTVLPEKCVAVSHASLRLADAVSEQNPQQYPELIQWVGSLLPLDPLLPKIASHREGQDKSLVLNALPEPYLKSLLSKVIAAECVYREGMTYFDPPTGSESSSASQPGAKAIDYIRAVIHAERIASGLEAEGKDQVAQVMRVAAPRSVLDHGLKGWN